VANDLVGTCMPPTRGRTEWLKVDRAVLDLGHLAPDARPALDRRLDDIASLNAVQSHPSGETGDACTQAFEQSARLTAKVLKIHIH
jgi:hypothetical protein